MLAMANIVRWGAVGLVVSGVLWVVSGILASGVVNQATGFAPVYFVVYIVALLLLVLGLIGLHALQRASYGRIGRAGFYTAVVASLAQVLGFVVLLAGSPALFWLASPVGGMGLVVGWVLYGAATLQAKVLPRWYGVLFIVSLPVTLVLVFYGNILFGLALVVLGYALWMRGGAPAEHPPRVR